MGGAPLHFLLAWSVAHLGFGLGGLRIVSAAFALASLPLVAALGRRLGGPRVGLVAAAIVAPSWLFLFHGVYGRMYSLFLFLSLACTLALLRALERGGRGRWAVWVAASLTMVAAHPYGILLLAGQAVYVLLAARDRIREAIVAGAAVLVLGIPFWLTDLVLARRFDVGVGGGGREARRAAGRRAVPLALGRRCDRGLVARHARRRHRRRRRHRVPPPLRRASSSSASSARPSRRSSSRSSAARRRPSRGT